MAEVSSFKPFMILPVDPIRRSAVESETDFQTGGWGPGGGVTMYHLGLPGREEEEKLGGGGMAPPTDRKLGVGGGRGVGGGVGGVGE